MNETPPLPVTVSRDGAELWDWAGRCSQVIHRLARIREIRLALRECGNVCGDCQKWMKSRECPAERPGEGRRAGYSVGPSMSSPICNQYVETHEAKERRERLVAELAQLEG